MYLPLSLSNNIINIHGQSGQRWLNHLTALLSQYQDKWQLTLGPCFPDANFHYLAPAVATDGTKAVLKCGIPS